MRGNYFSLGGQRDTLGGAICQYKRNHTHLWKPGEGAASLFLWPHRALCVSVQLSSVAQSCPILCNPMDDSLPGSSVHGDSARKNTGMGCHAHLQGTLPNPGTELRSPSLQEDSLPSELPGKPKNTGVGSLSLLQCIFLTQELNQNLLHCRHIL